MQRLLEPEVVALDPEAAAIVDEVCTALEWFDPAVPGSHEPAAAKGFGRKWWIAFRGTSDHQCRQAIIACCDAITRADDELVRTVQGQIFTRDQMRQYHARESYVTDSQTGEYHRLIEWPTGTYAGGAPSYEKPETAA